MSLFSPVLKKIFRDFDYQEHGGVPLLGVNGVVIIGHGKSSPKAIQNMIYRAIGNVRTDINGKIESALNPLKFKEQVF
jgi:glycerol-3-phosphate acyltransferase PlsX